MEHQGAILWGSSIHYVTCECSHFATATIINYPGVCFFFEFHDLWATSWVWDIKPDDTWYLKGAPPPWREVWWHVLGCVRNQRPMFSWNSIKSTNQRLHAIYSKYFKKLRNGHGFSSIVLAWLLLQRPPGMGLVWDWHYYYCDWKIIIDIVVQNPQPQTDIGDPHGPCLCTATDRKLARAPLLGP
jgi:hypothetical protein